MPQSGFFGVCPKCLYDDSIMAQNQTGPGYPLRERKFGDYELVRPLGRGGMGVVYEAIEVSLGRRVALKMILDADGASPSALRRFALEAEAVARLDHPNIVPLYQIGEVNGQPFLSMKLVPGETLCKKMANGEIGLAKDATISRTHLIEKLIRVAELMRTIAEAVEHAHAHGILHRDLKPANILVDQSGQPHLLDFGLAKMVQGEQNRGSGPETNPNAALGTPSYMSPEQAEGKPLTVASDIHSLGSILYEMLCGTPPFAGNTALETLKRIIEHHPVYPRTANSRIDKDLETICMKCLEKAPDARYSTAKALAEDLGRWLRHEPVRARPAGIPLRVARWVARNRLGTALILSLCLGLSVALVFLRQALVRQKMLDLRRANSLQTVNAGIDEMWKDPDKHSVKIASANLADLADLPPRLIDSLNIALTLGSTINHEPLGQALQYAPFLHELESRVERQIARPVLIDLVLYKFEADALRDLGGGRIQLQRMPPVAYVLRKQTAPGLRPLVRERGQREAVIFARKDSGITNLSQLAGKRLVLGLPTSETAFWGKVHLARAGVFSSALASCSYMAGESDENEVSTVQTKTVDRDPNQQAHKRVVRQIINGDADVGITPRRQFQLWRYRKHGLTELYSFPVSGDIYVGSPQLSQELAEALAGSLISFSSPADKAKLAQVAEGAASEGFERVSDETLAPTRAALEKEIRQFEEASAPRR